MPRCGSSRRAGRSKASTASRRTSSRCSIRVRNAVGSLTGASTSVKFTAPSLCRIRNRSSPPTTACSTEYSTSSRRGRIEVNVASRIPCVTVEDLGGHRAARRDEDVLVAPGATDGEPEPLVRFVIDLLGRQAGSEPMPPHRVGSPCVVDRDVVDGAVVGRPGGTRADADDRVVVHLTGAKVLELQGVSLVADDVDGERQRVAVEG